MLSLVGRKKFRNYKGHVPLFMLVKSPGLTQLVPPHKLSYYTEPYSGKKTHGVRNSLIAFIDENMCITIRSELLKVDVQRTHESSQDMVTEPWLYDDIYVHKTTVKDAKTLSSVMCLPLIIVLDKRGDGSYNMIFNENLPPHEPRTL